ncbi:MAG: hypothetical protein P9M14_15320 [Candidatus Alcyoniella australis]|nr:hypothetical protein [Candidatus Alcyoniella australis]
MNPQRVRRWALWAALLLLLTAGCATRGVAPPDLKAGVDGATLLEGMAQRSAELNTLSVWGVATYRRGSQRGFANFAVHLGAGGEIRLELLDPLYMPAMVLVQAHDSIQVFDVHSNVLYSGPPGPQVLERLAGLPLDPRLLFPAFSGRLKGRDGAIELLEGPDAGRAVRQGRLSGIVDSRSYLLTNFEFDLYEDGSKANVTLERLDQTDGMLLAGLIVCSGYAGTDRAERFSVELTVETARPNPELDDSIFVLDPGPDTTLRDLR